jgi:4-amino-4-deoxy-L-arabinose transferase-like glycosyltransferase
VSASRREVVLAWLFVCVFTVIWFVLAAGRPLANPDEGRYAEIPREMLMAGDWVVPRLNGVQYLEKPPLQYWATAIAYRMFGVNEWSARFWTLLCGWLDVVLVYLLARRLWGRRHAVLAAALLASSLLHFLLGQVLTLDMAFTAAMTAMLTAFCLARLELDRDAATSRRWMLVCWAMLAAATLTKGIVALVIAGGVLTLYGLWQRDVGAWRTLRPLPGIAVLLVLTAPWFVMMARANPDFPRFFFVHEHFQRYLTDEAQRIEPWWYFGMVLAIGVLPWLPQMGAALADGWRAQAERGQFDARRLLWLWCIFVTVFFSASHSKLAPYVLPVMPALALLAAADVRVARARGLMMSIVIHLGLAAALVTVAVFPDRLLKTPLAVSVAHSARPAVAAFAALAMLSAVLAWSAVRRHRPETAIIAIAAGWFLGLSVLVATIGHEESLRSGRGLARSVPAHLAADAPLFSVQMFDMTLPYYLERTIVPVDYRGELDYGLELEPGQAIDNVSTFEQLWTDLPEGVAFMSADTYLRLAADGLPMQPLGRNRKSVAVSRR